jgi:hypothetical protein
VLENPTVDKVRQPQLSNGRVVLRPIGPDDYGYIYWLEVHPDNSFRWRHRGASPSAEESMRSFWDLMLAAFIVVDLSSKKPCGLVCAFQADFRSGHCHVGVLGDPSFPRDRSHPALAGIGVLLNYVFDVWAFRKVYAEVVEFNYEQFSSITGPIAVEEGRLLDHDYSFGQYWDKIILAIHQDAWNRYGRRIVNRIGGRPDV